MVEKIGGELSVDGFDEYEKEYAKITEWVDLKDIDELKYINSVNSPDIIKKAVEMIKK